MNRKIFNFHQSKNFAEYILSIDQGTTSTRLALINKNLQIKNIRQKEHQQIHKQLNWTEHNPLELRDNIENIIKELHKDNEKVKKKFVIFCKIKHNI
jgi:glycerol kinase